MEGKMTEPEAHEAISLWRHCSLFGAPDEPDYGDPSPAGIKAVGLESQYRSPQIWEREEPKASATEIRGAYNDVERVYKALSKLDRHNVRGWYFGDRHGSQKEAQQRFVNAVMRAYQPVMA